MNTKKGDHTLVIQKKDRTLFMNTKKGDQTLLMFTKKGDQAHAYEHKKIIHYCITLRKTQFMNHRKMIKHYLFHVFLKLFLLLCLVGIP